MQSATVLTADARNGFFSYIGSDNAVHKVNVLQVAGSNGFPSAADPIAAGLLNTIAGAESRAVSRTSSPTDLIRDTIQWTEQLTFNPRFPTARLDYQVTPKLNWHGAWNLRWQHNDPVPNYPGLPTKGGEYTITTYVASTGADWTITPSLLNTFNFGIQSNREVFYGHTSIHQWESQGNRRINLALGLNPVIADFVPFIRNNPVYALTDNLSWVRGKHTFTFGGTTQYTSFYETSWGSAGVLGYNLGIATGDPVSSVFNSTTLPAIRTTDLSTATALYATLTGRLSSISGSRNVDEVTHEYKDFAPLTWRQAQWTGGVYFQDSFRWTPQLTLNYGFRWEFSGVDHNTNGIYSSPTYEDLLGPSKQLFKPGSLDGIQNPQIYQRAYAYQGDFINPAPNLGFAWNPDFGGGLLGKVLGSNRKAVIRGGYGLNYYDEGLNNIQAFTGNNPGIRQSVFINPGDPGFPIGGLSLSSPAPAFSVFPAKFAFPLAQSLFAFSNALSTTKPVLRTPYVQSWNLGIQREITRNTVLELRYVGNKATHVWHSYSLNETNIFENGFLQDFVNAQKNLAINRAAGVASFQSLGRPGQVALPVFDAAFAARGSQAALPAAQGYTNGAFITQLDLGNAGGLAGSLSGSQTYYCRLVGSTFGPCADRGFNAPGPYPINLFRPNPYPTNITVLDDNSFSTYHALQVEVRRALSRGLRFKANYTWSKTLSDLFVVDQNPTRAYTTLRNRKLDKGPAPFDLRHVFLADFGYELPFGPGHRLATGHSLWDRAIGGWTVSGIYRVSPGRVYKLTSGRSTVNGNDSGVVLNGNTLSQLQDKLTSLRSGPARNLFLADPSLVGADGRANPSVLDVPRTPGLFGQFLYLHGPRVFAADMALTKETAIREKLVFTFQVEALNVFNHPVFQLATIPSLTGGSGTLNIDSTSFGQTSSVIIGARNIQLRAQIRF